MVRLRSILFAVLMLGVSPAIAQDVEPDEIMETSDAEMDAARAQAQRTIGEWLAVLNDPPEGTGIIEFKYPLEGWEHIWVENVRRDGNVLIGTLANNPHSEGYRRGDEVRVPISEVSDWGYFDANEFMHGHYTTRTMLDRMDPAQAAEIREWFGWEQ